jgi:WD40 repeat protein
MAWDVGKMSKDFDSVPLPTIPLDARYSPSQSKIAVVCSDGSTLLLDAANGRICDRLSQKGIPVPWWLHPFKWVKFAPNGQLLVTLPFGREAMLWDLQATGNQHRLSHPDFVADVAISPDSRVMASACRDGVLRVFDALSGEQAAEPIIHPTALSSVAFNPNGDRIVTACRDGSCRVWNWRTGDVIGPPVEHGNEVHDAEFLGDSNTVVTLAFLESNEYEVRLIDVSTGQLLLPKWRAPRLRLGGLSVAKDSMRFFVKREGLIDIVSIEQTWNRALRHSDTKGVCQEIEHASGKVLQGNCATSLNAEAWLKRWKSARE